MELIRFIGRYPSKSGKSTSPHGLFKCSYCGKKVTKQLSNGNNAQSCGCMRYIIIAKKVTQHGGYKTTLFSRWSGIRTRCYNKKDHSYKYWGSRGIKMCKEWKNDFVAFRDWALLNGYKKDLQIDRINNDGDYTPENCRWVTSATNAQNRRDNKVNINKVRQIRYLHKNTDYNHREIGEFYNITGHLVGKIVRNERWKEVSA